MNQRRYDVGIDVGQSGIGIAAIEISDDETERPQSLLLSMVEIIDGARDPSSGKAPRSRKLISGVARRARRLTKRRAQRIVKLGELLDKFGISAGDKNLTAVTYEPWLARDELSRKYVPDTMERNWKLRLAILHIARHRGWRNPWWRYSALALAPTPTPGFLDLQRHAAEYFDEDVKNLQTLGAIGALAKSPVHALRPRQASWSRANATGESIINSRIFQEDQLSELRLILTHQKLAADQIETICQQVFRAERPTVKSEVVGRCALDPTQLRAPRSSLEFQEFRIRATIGNLRIRQTGERLSEDESIALIESLMKWEIPTAPSWDEVASWIGLEGPNLSFPSAEDAISATAPTMSTEVQLRAQKSKLKSVFIWWTKKSSEEQRKQFASWLGDATEGAEIDLIEDLINGLTGEELATLDGLTGIGSGRASYSRNTLTLLNTKMRNDNADLTAALLSEFGKDANWKAPAPSIFEHIDHPVVDQVATVIGRVLNDLIRQYGPPRRVNIEHVRSAFLSPVKLQEYNNETAANKWRNDRDRSELSQSGLEKISRNDIRRYQLVSMQNGKCLYCGDTIAFSTCEVDHIVPRRHGGSSQRDNLIAACKRCNGAKGSKPFAAWAETTTYASLEGARTRLKEWQCPSGRGGMSKVSFTSLKRRVSVRLSRKSHDEAIDERSLASTAYAAREIAHRAEGLLAKYEINESTGEVVDSRVWVFSGRVSSEARAASGIDRQILLRGMTTKSRLDRRHHAIDAAIVALLRPTIAKILATRAEMKDLARDTLNVEIRQNNADWKDYGGEDAGERFLYSRWKKKSERLTALVHDALNEDRVVVKRPLRLGANVGLLHDQTIVPLLRKPAAEPFTRFEVLRIVDNDLFSAARSIANDDGGLPGIANRTPTGTSIDDPFTVIDLHPGSQSATPTARLAVRGGSVAIGGSLHHVRVYAIRKKDGSIAYKQLRVFAGEFALTGFRKKGVDLFSETLPEWSQSVRCADSGLMRDIHSGDARQIGWLTSGDEIEFGEGYPVIPKILGFPIGQSFAPSTREKRWVVNGFENNTVLNIKPAYLASEGLPNQVPTDQENFDDATKILTGPGWRASLNQVMQLGPTILRRSSSGRPRWRAENGLPHSWNAAKETLKVFENDPVANS
jgi:CRISPR-associated endonuclease Csn1